MFCSCDASHASFRKLSDVLPSLCAHSCMFMVSSKPARPPQIFRKIFKRNFRTGNLLLGCCCKMLIKGWRKKHNSILCVFGLKVELYRASTYCRQCLTQKMQSNCNRRGGCIILKISPCHWSAPAVKTALEPTITFWPRRSSGWNVSSFADILHWRRRLWSARHPPLMIRCENCVCSTVCKECQSLSTVTGDKSQTIANYWAQLLHSSSSWSASLTPPVLLVEASKQKMIGQIPDSRNCTKPRHFLLSSQYSFSTFRWKKEND